MVPDMTLDLKNKCNLGDALLTKYNKFDLKWLFYFEIIIFAMCA